MKNLSFIITILLSASCVSAQSDYTIERNIELKNLINTEITETNINAIYLPEAVVDYTFNPVQGIEIINELKTLKVLIGELTSITPISNTIGTGNDIMEIGKISGSLGEFGYITAWRYKAGQYYIEYQIIKPINIDHNPELKGINDQRKEWEDQSNNHRPDLVLKNVYQEDAYYLNGTKLTEGIEAITERYNYMKNESWRISLTAEEVLPVSSNLALEIGIYQSTGQGQYLLIWEKDPSGKWMISLDFNF